MKQKNDLILSLTYKSVVIAVALLLNGCTKKLDYKTFNQISVDNFYKTANDANAAVARVYQGLLGGTAWSSGWGAAEGSWKVQDSQTTDEGVCYWGGDWDRFNHLDFTPDFGGTAYTYNIMMPIVSTATISISKVATIDMDPTLRTRYIAEMKALRAFYIYELYDYYGAVPVRLDPVAAADPNSPPIPRPTTASIVTQIETDFNDAIAVLPSSFTGADYGRVSSTACYMGLLKLYMHEKMWPQAVAVGEKLKSAGLSLVDYASNFQYSNKAGNSEIILAIPCTPTGNPNTNLWLAHVLPGDYADPTGVPLTQWNGYRMPWKTYNKFDPADKRLGVLIKSYTSTKGVVVDLTTNGAIGAIPVKYGPDPTKANSQNSGVNYVVYRYADAELLLAEAINEVNGGPTSEAYDLLNDVRTKHGGLQGYPAGADSHDSFLLKLQNERLFDLWFEGVRRDDLIRWGLYIKRAADDGWGTFATANKVLYPIPIAVIQQTNGVVKQNPGYN